MDSEEKRLRHLSSFALEYDSYKEDLRPFVELAKTVTDTSFCEVNIIDAYNQWTIARSKEGLKVIPREESICADTIEKNEFHEISDLKKSDEYKDRSYVTGDPYFRYYCGVQLISSEGFNIGSFCVLDDKTKTISDKQKQQLRYLADWIASYLEKEHKIHQKNELIYELEDQIHKINHDVRNPIGGIVGIVDMFALDQQTVEVPAKDLTMIKECAQAVTDKIDDHLKGRDESSSKDIGGVFQKVKKLYQPRAKKKKIQLFIEDYIEEGFEVFAYSFKKLVQIVSNLVANAIKFTNKGGNIVLEYKIEDNRLWIHVKDDGIGMEEDQVSAFNRGDEVAGSLGTEGELSFGIGLQHTGQLISQLGGRISAESVKGEGTTFTCTIPIGNL